MNFAFSKLVAAKMDLTELAKTETRLYSVVTSLEGSLKEKEEELEKRGIFKEYCQIHQEYAKLQVQSLEALKRGVFITWYASVESPGLTGIRELDADAEKAIIQSLDQLLKQNRADYELQWMLSHYAAWEHPFDRFNQYPHLQRKLKSEPVAIPASIDSRDMSTRGQMGIYWNFNSFFS